MKNICDLKKEEEFFLDESFLKAIPLMATDIIINTVSPIHLVSNNHSVNNLRSLIILPYAIQSNFAWI